MRTRVFLGVGTFLFHALRHVPDFRHGAWAGALLVAGVSLAAGMVLAMVYGVRYVFHPLPWLDLPWMRALHGSVNALGVGLCGVLGWRFAVKNTSLGSEKKKNT